ncbi:MAG TPA: nucleotidyl transferase AbiEii/AbiGii toxin family protein [Anaeromyxobacteraceae bacterium]|nr:nucleotidyl transferase AbiEii/AbiGii toxin family protein [Anaeromyxobacteraceae bacterium]
MKSVHDDPEFDALIQIVAGERRLSPGLIEKDYWVTHTLWALASAGFEVWFKGGTSLSKGFRLIQRFSEDLDVKIEPGTVAALPTISNWKSEGTKATSARRKYFERLAELLAVPAAQVALDPGSVDRAWRGANLRVTYPGRHMAELHNAMRPFRPAGGRERARNALREMRPHFVRTREARGRRPARDIRGQPTERRSIHPLVTLIEKLDNLRRRFPNERAEPATFVRHYEDAAHIITNADRLPQLVGYADARALAIDMLEQKQIAALPSAADRCLVPDNGSRWAAIRAAHAAIGQMFWAPRISVEGACVTVQGWISETFG